MNFYMIFIKNYSKLVASFTQFIRKDKFIWNNKAEGTFEILKQSFTSTLIFFCVHLSKLFYLLTNPSNFALDSLFSQYRENNELHLLAFCSWKNSTVKINNEIYNKELLTIDAFENSHLLKGVQYTYHGIHSL